jgi:hypothetical protein
MNRLLLALSMVVVLAGCGGGSGSSSTPTEATLGVVTGTAAVGAPLPAATVLLRDRNGKEKTTTTTSTGGIASIDISDMSSPVMLRATGSFGGNFATLHSVIFSGTNANLTPFTDAAILLATGKSPSTLFNNPSLWVTELTQSKLNSAQAELRGYLSNYFSSLGIDANYDFFKDPFTANGTKVDALADYLRVITKSDGSGFVIQDKLSKDNKLVVTRGVVNPAKLNAPTYTSNLIQRANNVLLKYTEMYSGTQDECKAKWSAITSSWVGKGNGFSPNEIANFQCSLTWSANAGVVYSDPIIKYCNGEPNLLSRCFVQRTATFKSGLVSTADQTMDLSGDSTVAPTGANQNTSPFWASVRPALEKFVIIDRDFLPDALDTTKRINGNSVVYPGLLVFINSSGYADKRNPLDGTDAPTAIRSAKVYAGDSSGVELGRLNLYPGRTGALLRDTPSQIYMSSILALSSAQVKALRDANGKVTIQTYSDLEYTTAYQSGVHYISSPFPTDEQIADASFALLDQPSIDLLRAGGSAPASGSGYKLSIAQGSPPPSSGYLLSSMKTFTKTGSEGAGVIEFQSSGALPASDVFLNNPQIDVSDISAVLYRTRYVRCGKSNLDALGCAASGR